MKKNLKRIILFGFIAICFFAIFETARAATSSNTFISQVKDAGQASDFTTISWTDYVPAGTTVVVSARAGNTATPDASWANYDWSVSFAKSGALDILDGNRYVQYSVVFTYTDTSLAPNLQDIIINYVHYNTGTHSLTSSKYDTSSGANVIASIAWDEDATLPSGTGVTVSLRAASSAVGLDSASWADFTNATTNCSKATSTVTCSSSAIPTAMKDGVGDQWVQYKIALTSTGANTPTVDNIIITYAVNAPPQFNPSYGTNGVSVSQVATSTDANWSKVQIQYAIRDTDTASSTITPGYITPSFEYNIGSGWASSTSFMAAGDTNNKAVSQDTYTTYTAYWDAKSQIPGTYSSSTQIRITLNDNEAANNTTSTASASFILDTKNPVDTITLNVASSALAINLSDDSNIEYRVSNLSDFSDASWQSVGGVSTSTTVSWTPTGTYPSYPTVYVNTRDIYANTATSTIVAPYIPQNFDIKDVSNVNSNEYGEFISWSVYSATTSAAFANYKVYRSTDGTNYSVVNTIANVNVNYYRDTSLASSTTYYYKVLITDTNADVSNFSSSQSDRPDGQGGSDYTPPTITNASSTIQATWARITWTTDELSNSEINYSASSPSYNLTASSTSYITSHEITLSDLTPNTVYYYRVKSKDILNNVKTDDNSGAGYSFTTLGGPIISDVATESVTDNSAAIIWNTNKTASSSVVYSTNLNNLKSGGLTSETSLVASTVSGPPFQQRVLLSGLTDRTTYYYYVKSTDSDSNLATDTNAGNYYSFKTTYDTKAPALSNVSVAIATYNSAIINWKTDEDSTSQIETGIVSGSYSTSTSIDTTKSIYHSVTVIGLTNSTKYYFRAKSKDSQDNEGISSESNFTTSDINTVTVYVNVGGGGGGDTKDTAPPAISDIKVSDVGAFEAAVSLATNEQTTAYVLYGKDSSYGSTIASSEFSQNHKLKFSGLKLGTTYHYQIKAQDKSGNFTRSEDKTFNTKFAAESLEETVTLENAAQFQEQLENIIETVMPSLVPPFIGKVDVSDITETSVAIAWRSNVPTFGAVAYVSEQEYDSEKTNPYIVEISAGDKKVRDQKIELTGLSPSTGYHFQAKGFVIPGVVGKSKDLMFTTKASKIRAEVARLGNTNMDVRWTTPEETSSFAEYRDIKTGKISRTGDETKVKSHALTLENLTPNTSYQIKVFGYNNKNNIVEGDSVAIKTKKDIVPPEISKIRIDNALLPGRSDRLQSVISWRTDESANSIVHFEEGVGMEIDETLANKIGQEKEYTTDHIVIITNFKPATVYRVQIVSADESGNETKSSIKSILTPRSAESILDIITKNLQDTFGFLKKLQR